MVTFGNESNDEDPEELKRRAFTAVSDSAKKMLSQEITKVNIRLTPDTKSVQTHQMYE